MKNTMFFMATGCTLSEETVLSGNETSLLLSQDKKFANLIKALVWSRLCHNALLTCSAVALKKLHYCETINTTRINEARFLTMEVLFVLLL